MNSYLKKGLIIVGLIAVIDFVIEILNAESLDTKIVSKAALVSILTGFTTGLIMVFVMYRFTSSKFVAKNTAIEVGTEEKIVFEGLVNHVKGIEGVGGRLYLTNKRVIFKSHGLNIQDHLLEIPVQDLISVENIRPKLGIIKNGLCIKTTSGVEKFVVNDAQKWMKHLTEAKKNLKS